MRSHLADLTRLLYVLDTGMFETHHVNIKHCCYQQDILKPIKMGNNKKLSFKQQQQEHTTEIKLILISLLKNPKSYKTPQVCPQISNDLQKLQWTHAFEKQHANLYKGNKEISSLFQERISKDITIFKNKKPLEVFISVYLQ